VFHEPLKFNITNKSVSPLPHCSFTSCHHLPSWYSNMQCNAMESTFKIPLDSACLYPNCYLLLEWACLPKGPIAFLYNSFVTLIAVKVVSSLLPTPDCKAHEGKDSVVVTAVASTSHKPGVWLELSFGFIRALSSLLANHLVLTCFVDN
jgi:hypothetical protein